MARIRYQVAASLDGYIAAPNGDHDWIVMDPEIDFGALFEQFDTFVMGRRTFESAGAGSSAPGAKTYVFSRTLRAADHPHVTVIPEVSAAAVKVIRDQAEKDIWLFGGGALFRSFLDAGLVDTVEVALMPVLLGGGVPLVPPGARAKLALTGHRLYKSGVALLEYSVGAKREKGSPAEKRRSSNTRRAAK
ncbi:MAG TPA: dihydrofolate reductase family protein [Gammaproteobacteria bacterium]|nr:dihydrofolate reductase family protein [Gammaproteobacteria bacterium]